VSDLAWILNELGALLEKWNEIEERAGQVYEPDYWASAYATKQQLIAFANYTTRLRHEERTTV
jgi:hypothetical protein